jgi:uncharacterized membrane protein SpoIIM required for sporulation
MVMEAMISTESALDKPWLIFLIGILYGILSVILATVIFNDYVGLVVVIITVLFSLPLVYTIIKQEAYKGIEIADRASLLKEHRKAIRTFLLLFMGFTIAFAGIYLVSSQDYAQNVFSVQLETLSAINGKSTKIANNPYLEFKINSMVTIILNNVRVLVFCILFSFIFGAGSLFILSWNGSVLGVAMGSFVRDKVTSVLSVGAGGLVYLGYILQSVIRYSIHGIPEILAYVIAGIAGGIISFAVSKHGAFSKHFENVLVDTADLLLIAVGILVVAGVLEVFITPFFY